MDALTQARRRHHAGDTAGAIAACRAAAPEQNPVAARLLGLLLAEAGANEEALHWVGHATTLGRSAETLAALGRVLALQDRWLDAVPVLQEALVLTPGFAAAQQLLNRAGAALYRLGTARHDSGAPAEAVPAYRAALALDPRRFETWHNLGSALQALGALDDALHAYAQAYRLDPACFPRIAQELAAGRAGQVWLRAADLRSYLTGLVHDTPPDRRRASPGPHPPPR